MNKAVLLSIKPEYCHLIAKGEKTVEVRKSKPKLKPSFKCYIYCTSKDRSLGLLSGSGTIDLIVCSNWKTAIPVGGEIANGKVIGEFVCNNITTIFYGCEIMYGIDYPNKHAKQLEDDSCLSLKELKHYADGKDVYGWHISNLKIYDKPKELSDFGVLCPEFSKDSPICEGCRYENTLYSGLEPPEFDCKCDGFKPLTRPPQSWCYVEEIEL